MSFDASAAVVWSGRGRARAATVCRHADRRDRAAQRDRLDELPALGPKARRAILPARRCDPAGCCDRDVYARSAELQRRYDVGCLQHQLSGSPACERRIQGDSPGHDDRRHNQGFQYVHYDYIGGVPVDTGSMYFYSVDLSVQNEHHYIPIIFQTDADGKIVDISSPLYPPP